MSSGNINTISDINFSGTIITHNRDDCEHFIDLLIILLDLRPAAAFYIAVAFVGCDDDTVWADLAAHDLEGRGDGAVAEEAFAGAERDGEDHQFESIDEIVLEQRLEHIGTSHYVKVGAFRLFQLPYVFRKIAAQENTWLPIA